MNYNGKAYENINEIANAFADFFQSTYGNTKIYSHSNKLIFCRQNEPWNDYWKRNPKCN